MGYDMRTVSRFGTVAVKRCYGFLPEESRNSQTESTYASSGEHLYGVAREQLIAIHCLEIYVFSIVHGCKQPWNKRETTRPSVGNNQQPSNLMDELGKVRVAKRSSCS